ncbi:MAG: DUF4352 domain-containing protein [Chloroflexota bacterium]
MDRRKTLPIAVIFITLVCVAVIYLSKNWPRSSSPTTVIVGSASPVGSSGVQGVAPIGPHLDESNGILTIDAGDSVDSNGVLFGVTSVVAPYTSSGATAAKPRAGEFMVVNVQVHNSLTAGGDPLTISSATNFELQDATGRVYDETTVPGAPKAPDGKIGPGETLDGGLAYDVPLGQNYRLLFKETLVSQGVIVVDLGRR